MTWRALFENPATGVIACGLCYEWAYHDVLENGGWLVQGTVREPLSSTNKRYNHAWVERAGRVYDWQTMVAHHGGKFMGKGYPRTIFYELYEPQDMRRFDDEEAMIQLARNRHYGPWS